MFRLDVRAAAVMLSADEQMAGHGVGWHLQGVAPLHLGALRSPIALMRINIKRSALIDCSQCTRQGRRASCVRPIGNTTLRREVSYADGGKHHEEPGSRL